jgi:MFS family permease
MPKHSFSRRLVDGVTMFIVTGLSLLLLVYVGFGEGKRIYEQFHIEKLTGHGRIVQNIMENYLRAGLPLNQYAGFSQLSEPLVEIQEIDALVVYDQTGRQVFLTIDKNQQNLPDPAAIGKRVRDDVIVESGPTHYQVALPLRTRFETVGSLVVVSSTDIVGQRLQLSFEPLLFVVLGLSFVFSMIVAIAAPYLARSRMPWLQVGYAVTFLTMAVIVVATLVNLYSDGVQGKAKAAAMNLSQRVTDVVEFNLRFRDFSGLDRTFSDYRRLNPEISEAALILDGAVQISTEATRIGKAWTSDARTYEYLVEVARPDSTRRVTIAVSVPKDLVYGRVERSVRNFAALFVASAFMAGLFLQVASSMQRVREVGSSAAVAARANVREETALIFVKPIFFLAVFLEHLTYSFLPQFMQQAASASGLSVGFASASFTAYYLSFALSLIPAGHFADRFGPRRLIWLGLTLASASVFGLVMPGGIVEMTALRALAGVGQGMLFIGIQSYILAVASPEKKTQGAAIIVFGFQGGMISGMAIGSLLVTYLGAQGVFVVSGAIGLATALYSILLIPGDIRRKEMKLGLAAALRRVGSDLRSVIGSGEFLRTMFCIGIPAKAILTGTITFALPLLLTQQGYRQEEIGQIIMLYGMGVVAASTYISRVVDRTRNTDGILFWGAALSGIGLWLLGLMGAPVLGNGLLGTVVVVTGVILIGLAHGFINAPVVTHVAHSDLAARIGANPVTTAYRFLERVGHIVGPLLVGQIFLIWGQNPQVLTWIGGAAAILGVLFILGRALPPRIGAMGPEAA